MESGKRRENMTSLELLFEIRDKYDLSTLDMAKLLGVRDSTMQKWVSFKQEMPGDIYAELIEIEQEIMWLAAYIKANPDLGDFVHAHFKAAINSLGGEDAN